MILSRFAAQGLTVIFTILLARQLGRAEFGSYVFIAALLFVANALTTFGTDMLLIREIAAQDRLDGLLPALAIQLILSFALIVIAWSFGAWIPNQSRETVTALKVYSFTLIPLAFFNVFTSALRGKQLMDVYALLNVVVVLFQIAALWMLREGNLIVLSGLLLSAQVLAAFCAGFLCYFTIPDFWKSWRLSPTQLSYLVKGAAPIALLTVLAMLYQRLGVTMLSLMRTPSDTGIFSAAARMVEASKTAHIAVFTALYPAIASSISLRSDFFPGKSLKALVIGALLISSLLFFLAMPLVQLFYGNEFIASTAVLEILAWTLLPFTINTYLTLLFLAQKRENFVGLALMVSLLGLLILNLWWIPTRGPEGSAWASLIAEILQLLLLVFQWNFSEIRYQKKPGFDHELSDLP